MTFLYNMASHMKTTVEIPDALLAEAQRVVHHERTTLRALIEEGLRQVLQGRRRRPRFRLRDAAVDGEGIAPEFSGGSWDRVRDAIYEDHGA